MVFLASNGARDYMPRCRVDIDGLSGALFGRRAMKKREIDQAATGADSEAVARTRA